MDDTYLTISRTSEGIYKEKMSKFLAFAIPVSSVEDVKKQLETDFANYKEQKPNGKSKTRYISDSNTL